MTNFSFSAANVDKRVDALANDSAGELDDKICAEEPVKLEETIDVNKLTPPAVDVEDKDVAGETADVGNKTCVDETADVGNKTCVDETADVAEEIVGATAVLANPIGIANDELADGNVPLAPPLLHGS